MTEKFSNFAVNQLSAAMATTATSCSLHDASSFPTSGSFRIKIDDEILVAQVREYDIYAETGCCKWAYDHEDIKRTLRWLEE